MEELTPAQALAEFEGGLSYAQLEKKYGISNHSAQSLVKRGRAERGGDSTVVPPKITPAAMMEEDLEEGAIRVSEAIRPRETYKVVKPVPFHPVSGGGPFNPGDVLCIESFPYRKYAEWRLRNLVAEGRITRVSS